MGDDGDEQSDLSVHGGTYKAVYVYPSEHYVHWSERLGVPIGPGGFGENFTTAGLDETTVHIGDVYRVGEALVQVSQPRSPCFKLAARHRAPRLPLWVPVLVVLLLPALEFAGLRPTIGLTSSTLGVWLLGSGLRVAVIMVLSYLLLRIIAAASRRLEDEMNQVTAPDQAHVGVHGTGQAAADWFGANRRDWLLH